MSEHIEHAHDDHSHDGLVHLPAPTLWPFLLATGVSLLLAGLVTHWLISLMGFLFIVPSIVGWFRNVLPSESSIYVPALDEPRAITTMRQKRPPVALLKGTHFELKPIETFSVGAGVRGGIAGGIAMVIPAAIFGLLKHGSIWYPVNLLAAGGFIHWAGAPDSFLATFHLNGFLAALVIHGLTSLLVGLLYGALLPIFPRKPIITGGIVTPLIMSGILYGALGVISPILNQRISWPWFIVSQVAFGLVCGFVVNLSVKVSDQKFRELPFAVRAGLHSDQPMFPGGESKH